MNKLVLLTILSLQFLFAGICSDLAAKKGREQVTTFYTSFPMFGEGRTYDDRRYEGLISMVTKDTFELEGVQYPFLVDTTDRIIVLSERQIGEEDFECELLHPKLPKKLQTPSEIAAPYKKDYMRKLAELGNATSQSAINSFKNELAASIRSFEIAYGIKLSRKSVEEIIKRSGYEDGNVIKKIYPTIEYTKFRVVYGTIQRGRTEYFIRGEVAPSSLDYGIYRSDTFQRNFTNLLIWKKVRDSVGKNSGLVAFEQYLENNPELNKNFDYGNDDGEIIRTALLDRIVEALEKNEYDLTTTFPLTEYK
ncbi:hypothetical protein [Helicobacter sp. T3_23-1059]